MALGYCAAVRRRRWGLLLYRTAESESSKQVTDPGMVDQVTRRQSVTTRRTPHRKSIGALHRESAGRRMASCRRTAPDQIREPAAHTHQTKILTRTSSLAAAACVNRKELMSLTAVHRPSP